jgi:DNA-binding transcriptional MerR regulator
VRSELLTIGQLAADSGCKVPTIRYYETCGLLDRPERTSGNQRRYSRADLERLRFIRRARELGFPLEAVQGLLAVAHDGAQPCADADRIARAQLAEVERKIRELKGLRVVLKRMVEQCRQDVVANCRVLATLADGPDGFGSTRRRSARSGDPDGVRKHLG